MTSDGSRTTRHRACGRDRTGDELGDARDLVEVDNDHQRLACSAAIQRRLGMNEAFDSVGGSEKR